MLDNIDIYLVFDLFLLLLIGMGPKIALVPFLEATQGVEAETQRKIANTMVHIWLRHAATWMLLQIFLDTARIVHAIDNPYPTGELNWEWARLCLKAGDVAAAREKLGVLEEMSAATQHANLLLWRSWLSPRLLCAEERYEEALTTLNESSAVPALLKGMAS